MLGHVFDNTMRRMANYYGKTVEKLKNCKDCVMGKSQQANMNRETVEQASELGERLFMNISLTEHESYGKAKFWLSIIDNVTDFCWSYFLKSKSKTKQVMINLIKELNDKNKVKVRKV